MSDMRIVSAAAPSTNTFLTFRSQSRGIGPCLLIDIYN